MKAKGVGELGICGVARRSRTLSTTPRACACGDYPITLDKFLDRLPAIV